MTYLSTLASIVLAGIVGVAFVGLIYGVVRLIAPHNPYRAKTETYECGHTDVGEAWVPYRIQYYTFALMFLIFDIETAFLFPWGVVYRRLGWYGLVEMVIFIVILLVGLLYAWRKGALRWA